MEAPIGFVSLQQAVDIVGRRVIGASWRPIADPEEYAAHVLPWRFLRDSAVESVITVIAERCEAGEIAAAYRSITGADDLDRAEWRKPGWRNYFWDGTIDLDLPLVDSRLRPDPNGDTARCTREVFVRKDQLIGWLDRNAPIATAEQSASPAPVNRRKPRTQSMRDRARAAIAAQWPAGIPKPAILPNKRLCEQVIERLKKYDTEHGISAAMPSDDTILRAAGRKGSRAAEALP